MEKRPYTLFLDIDGTLLYHNGSLSGQMNNPPKLLPGVLEKFEKWDKAGYKIILTTGRKESLREMTIKQLSDVGLFFDDLIMGIGGGKRILVNDLKPNSSEPTAIAINIERNKGVEDIDI